jgi:hypothetical protein
VSEHHHLKDLREHLPHRHHAEEPAAAEETAGDDDQPIPGYDNFSVHELMTEFHRHTQEQLDACEEYERSHKNRTAVLDKLAYMHTRQPWPGYDDMSEDEVIARLESSDDVTIKAVRDYERKFARRPRVHDHAMQMHHKRQAAKPDEGPRPYQAGGGSFDNL